MSITTGHTYGASEQVTYTKMNNMVNNAVISLQHTEISSNLLTSLASSAGSLSGYNINKLQSLASSAGFVNWFNLSSFTSLASGVSLRYNGNGSVYWA